MDKIRIKRLNDGVAPGAGVKWTAARTLDQLELPRTGCVYPGLVGTIQDQLVLPWTNWDYPGLVGTTQEQLGLPWTSWNYPGLVGTTQDQLGLPWTSWNYLGLIGTTQNQLGLPRTRPAQETILQDFRIKFKLSDLNPVCFSFCVFVLSENQCNQTFQKIKFHLKIFPWISFKFVFTLNSKF